MLVLRSLNYHQYLLKFSSQCFRSRLSHSSTPNDQRKDPNNEWLWAYLRDRKTFPDLTEEQRRRVVEIGLNSKAKTSISAVVFCFFCPAEVQTLRESGERVPEVIPEERWQELINLPLAESRKTLYG